VILILAIIVYVVGSVVACRVFGDFAYSDVKELHKLAGFFVLLSAIGLSLKIDNAKEIVLFQQLSPLAQYSFVAALILWTYLAFIRVRGES